MAQATPSTEGSSEHRAAGIVLDALCERDFDRLAETLAPDVTMRAVLPPRILDVAGNEEALSWFRKWFGAADHFEVVDRSVGDVAGRPRISYRFSVAPHPTNGDPATHVIEQTVFCDEVDGRIVRLDLLCSGFRTADTKG